MAKKPGDNYQLGSLVSQVGNLLPSDDPKLVADCQATMGMLSRFQGDDRALLVQMIGLQDYV